MSPPDLLTSDESGSPPPRTQTFRAWPLVLFSAVALLIAGSLAVCALPRATLDVWSGSKLSPIAAWRVGIPLYPPPLHGAILVRMYGPVSSIIYWPAVLSARPSTDLLIGAALNGAMISAAIVIYVRATRIALAHWRWAALGLIALALTTDPILLNGLTTTTIEAPTLVGLLLASALLLNPGRQREWFRGGLIGVCIGLSVWSKQTAWPACGLFLAILLIARRRQCALGMIFAVIGFSIVVIAACGGRDMLFWMWTIPSRQPSWSNQATVAQAWFFQLLDLLKQIAISLLVAAAALSIYFLPANAALRRHWPSILLPIAVLLALLPGAVAALAKVGGDANNFVPLEILLYVSAAVALTHASARSVTLAIVANLTLALGLILLHLPSELRTWRQFDRWQHLHDAPVDLAWEMARSQPGHLYFPQFPLASILAEGRAYHSGSGLRDLQWAGFPSSLADYPAGLPPHLTTIYAYRDIQGVDPTVWPRTTVIDRSDPNWNVIRLPASGQPLPQR